MRFGRVILTTALVFGLVFQAGVLMGLNTGVEAGTWAEASASFDGEAFTAGGETTEIDYTDPDGELKPTGFERFVYANTPLDMPETNSAWAAKFANGMIWFSFHLAAIAGLIGAKVGYLLPMPGVAVPTINAVSQLTSLLAVAGVGYIYLRPVVNRI